MTATLAAIDGVVAGDGTGFEKLRVAAGHMPMLAGNPATASVTAGNGGDLPRTH